MTYTIAVSYRDEAWGKGAFFDHFTVRKMTGKNTVICKPEDMTTINIANYINLRSGDPKRYPLPLCADIPATADDWAKESGFIFIPGYTRESDNKQPDAHKKRIAFEKELIRKARLRGQPVLAVCAGSWTLWESFGGSVKEVSGHNYGGAMPRLSTQGPEVCNNKMIHKVAPIAGTNLAGGMKSTESFAVNSVHWKAPDEKSMPKGSGLLEVSAYSSQDDSLAPKSRLGQKMKPEKCVEAFETTHGVPMMGIQWHPEAFNPSDGGASKHQSIFSSMVNAGQTYKNRQKLNQEFKTLVSKSHNHFFFKNQNKPAAPKPTELKFEMG